MDISVALMLCYSRLMVILRCDIINSLLLLLQLQLVYAGSSTDYIYLLNYQSSFFALNILAGSVISYYPIHYTPQTYVAPAFPGLTTSSGSTYNVSITPGLSTTIPALDSSAVALFNYALGSVALAPIGFNFTFYNVAYISVVVATNGNLQFATASTASTLTIPTSTVSPVIAWLFAYLEAVSFVLLPNDW